LIRNRNLTPVFYCLQNTANHTRTKVKPAKQQPITNIELDRPLGGLLHFLIAAYGWLRTLRNHLVNGSHCSQSGHARYSGNSKMPRPRV